MIARGVSELTVIASGIALIHVHHAGITSVFVGNTLEIGWCT